ncbi:MAG: M2 family metallopeptidase, partial [Candidatus Omnitrophica bacterium]|nr:M2 family metallopeptidase [Candidatus Omnitrophota bacterium]
DLNKLWWDLVEEYQMIKKPEGRDEPDWASKIHIATEPAYYHNYMLGKMLASQLQYYISKNIINSENPDEQSFTNKKDVGEFLKSSIFKQGARYRWDKLIKKALGEKLNPEYFAKQFISE